MSTDAHEGDHKVYVIPDFNENLVVSRNFNITSTYQISNPVICSGGVTGGRTDIAMLSGAYLELWRTR